MYGFVDANEGQIECVYTGFTQVSGFVTFPDPINAEHIIPQSFYGSASPMRSDIHNLRPAHGSANSARANYPLGEVNDNNAIWYGVNINNVYFSSTQEPGNSDEFSERDGSLWEPREDRKGDIARQIFYFFTMYPTQAGDITSIGDPQTFYQWHLDDPADAAEITRNNRIQTAQGNRNPYVVYPDLVYQAWFWQEVLGCTDPTASNYDSNANTDDGSCEYIVDIEGCTYAAALNYDPNATIEDGSCLFPTYVMGCTYPEATNYSPSANFDDGSCVYPDPIEGCTNSTATNYDPNANLDDGSCVYPQPQLGCTYLDATNYSPAAEEDDGSCIFESANPCPSDINLDGQIDIQDMLILLQGFGNPCD